MEKRSRTIKKVKNDNLDSNRKERLLSWVSRRLGYEIRKTEPRIPSFVFEPRPVIRKPEFDYISLFEVATTSWPLRRAFRAIIGESTRSRWIRVPKFKFKCTNEDCGKEFQITPPENKCSMCGSELREPSEEQAELFDTKFGPLGKPNRDYRMDDLVRSSMFYDLALDDWYWSIAYKKVPKSKDGKIILDSETKEAIYEKNAAEVYIEDSRFTFPVADEYGHLGGYDWFCSDCYGKGQFKDQDQPVVQILPDTSFDQQEKLKICPVCKGSMTQTAYVQEVSGEVLARFGADEIIHGSSQSIKPALFGNSMIVSVWKLVQTVLAMDDYNWEVYSEGKVGSIIGFPGEDQIEVEEKKTAIESELNRLDSEDITTGRYITSKKIRTLMLGLKKDQKPVRIPIMEDLKAMQSVEFYHIYLNAIGEVYGVTPEFVSAAEAGLGTKIKIEVQNRTTEERQSNFADQWNMEVLPKFDITDWLLEFKEIEARDELRDAQVLHTKMATVLTAVRCGLDADVDEQHKVRIHGKAKLVGGGEGEGSRITENPHTMMGKPASWVEGEPTRVEGEKLELMEGGTRGRAPFGVVMQGERLDKQFKKLIRHAKSEVTKGREKSLVIRETLIKADSILNQSFEELTKRALSHVRNRTGKEVSLSPEETKRLNTYKKNNIEDFEEILRDSLK